MLLKICASISEVQLKRMQSWNISSNFTLASLKEKSCINMKLFLYLLHYENGYIKYDQVTA